MGTDLETRLKRIVADKLGVNAKDVKMEDSIIGDLGADSLDVVELIMAFEEEFELGKISEEDEENLTTIQDVLNYVIEHGGKGNLLADRQ